MGFNLKRITVGRNIIALPIELWCFQRKMRRSSIRPLRYLVGVPENHSGKEYHCTPNRAVVLSNENEVIIYEDLPSRCEQCHNYGHVAVSCQLTKVAPEPVNVTPASVGGASLLVVEQEVGLGENLDDGVGARTPYSEEEGDSDDVEDSVLPDKGSAGVSKFMETVPLYVYLIVEFSRNEVRGTNPMKVALLLAMCCHCWQLD
ncbi:hypothetical protein NE237_001971 [Protea cynaroides]|uniref:Uncharacterized protein n=1 Tax=Protea cynaroides TaxID=273540 RepID=A0A9Q0KUB6_9MAGN|nr:hypothetical protein NE237_001971 [Protea cynaroides]